MSTKNFRYISKNISKLYRASLVYINENLKEFNITSSEYLYIINIPEDKSVNLTYLSKKLYVDPSLTTKVINNLVKKGFIEKIKSKNDKRAYDINLTKQGIEIKPKILKVLESWNDVITKEMDIIEKENILNSLETMSTNAENR